MTKQTKKLTLIETLDNAGKAAIDAKQTATIASQARASTTNTFTAVCLEILFHGDKASKDYLDKVTAKDAVFYPLKSCKAKANVIATFFKLGNAIELVKGEETTILAPPDFMGDIRDFDLVIAWSSVYAAITKQAKEAKEVEDKANEEREANITAVASKAGVTLDDLKAISTKAELDKADQEGANIRAKQSETETIQHAEQEILNLLGLLADKDTKAFKRVLTNIENMKANKKSKAA